MSGESSSSLSEESRSQEKLEEITGAVIKETVEEVTGEIIDEKDEEKNGNGENSNDGGEVWHS